MKLSYSKRWVLTFSLLLIGVLFLVSGIFSLATNLQLSSALLLIGLGLSGPAACWLRRSSRWSGQGKMRLPFAVGVIALTMGAVLMPWGSYFPSSESSQIVEDRAGLLIEENSDPQGETPSLTPSAEVSAPTPSSTISEERSPKLGSSTQTVTVSPAPLAPATVTEVETILPPTVTVVRTVISSVPPLISRQDSGLVPTETARTDGFPGEARDPEPSEESPEETGDVESSEEVPGDGITPEGIEDAPGSGVEPEPSEPAPLPVEVPSR